MRTRSHSPAPSGPRLSQIEFDTPSRPSPWTSPDRRSVIRSPGASSSCAPAAAARGAGGGGGGGGGGRGGGGGARGWEDRGEGGGARGDAEGGVLNYITK